MAMCYPTAFGCLEAQVINLAIELKYATNPIDGKALAKRLREMVRHAEERGGLIIEQVAREEKNA
jgi:hypothetical protein